MEKVIWVRSNGILLRHQEVSEMAKSSPHKGSWGDGYIIEQPKNKKRISCSNCKNYSEDGSCYVYPIVISSVGYNYWKYCKGFVLARESYTEERAEYILRTIGPKAIERNIQKAVDRRESINPEVMTRKASNAIPLIVQYEDQVIVRNLSKNTVVKFKAAPGFFNAEPSPIVKACLGKKQDEVFFMNGNEYKIINIEKGQGD